MAAGLLRRPKTLPGRTLSALYFTNSLGAAAGVLLAGFYLIYSFGLPGTLLFAAMINLVVALVTAITISRYPGASAPRAQAAREAAIPEEADLSLGLLTRLLLGVSFGTAVASFAYEIGWLRMLSLVLGSATHSFELMLSAFILGLALGALWVRRRADEWRKPLRALGFVQLAMGISALATLSLYGASFYWMRSLLQTFAPSAEGYTAFTLARYGISLAIMFPASFCAGMTLPLITRTLLVNGAGERSIGTVYGVNTFGAIVGVAAAGFLFMPLVGLKGVIIGGATLDMALGVAVLHVAAGRNAFSRRLVRVGLAVTIVLFGAATLLGRGSFDTRLLASGVYRTGVIPEPGEREYIFHEDGRTATVTVERNLESGNLIIRTNGKPDASLDPAPRENRWPTRSVHEKAPASMAFPAAGLGQGLCSRTSNEATSSCRPLPTSCAVPDTRTKRPVRSSQLGESEGDSLRSSNS